jgi:hypothetical protein
LTNRVGGETGTTYRLEARAEIVARFTSKLKLVDYFRRGLCTFRYARIVFWWIVMIGGLLGMAAAMVLALFLIVVRERNRVEP